MVRTLLVKNIHTLVTMDSVRTELRDAAIFARGPVIEQIGTTSELPATADEVLDLKGRHVVLPGLVNTHHHFFQHLTRAVPGAQDRELFGWLKILYPIWANLTAEAVYTSAPNGGRGAGAVRLHYVQRSSVSVPQRLLAGC